ncbi:MAG: hypothetical protein L7S51_01275 [Candidatus Marinimicrobia bacterium]|nr:hypothetical protein [Candidatus Neomarinimicrobiota bacterium]
MNFKYKLLFLTCSLNISIGQEVIPFDVSNQFAVPLSNNQLAWNTDLSFNKLLIDRSSKNFRQKFTNLTFEELPNDSTYVKSKFIYEFGDYGFDKLSVGLKKHSKDNNFEFIGMKKSFFGQYSEFADSETPPLSLFYKLDYSKSFERNKIYSSLGYFRENSNFLFDSSLDSNFAVPNNEFSDFISLTIGNSFSKNDFNFDLQLNHISKYESSVINEYNINSKYDLDRNRFIAEIHKNNILFLNIVLNNSFYDDKKSFKRFALNSLSVTRQNHNFSVPTGSAFPVGELIYGFDLFEDHIKPNIYYKNIFGNLDVVLKTRNQHSIVLMNTLDYIESEEVFIANDRFSGNEVEEWKNLTLTYYFNTETDFSASLKYVKANNFVIPEADRYKFINDDMLSLQMKIEIPFKYGIINFNHSYNFDDSLISSNRAHILNLDYLYSLSFIENNLGIDGKLSLQYMSKNNSDYSFNYFKNMPERNNNIDSDEYINISMNTEIAISDVLLTVRLQNALGKFYSNEDYSLENHEFFNPMSSLLTFGIIWEFDD